MKKTFKKPVLVLILLTFLCIGLTSCGSENKSSSTTENNETTNESFISFSFEYMNALYGGFDEEVSKENVGEYLSDTWRYVVNPDGTEAQREGSKDYIGKIYRDKTSVDYTSVIVLTHKDKYVRARFDSMRGTDETINDIKDIFVFDQRKVTAVLKNGKELFGEGDEEKIQGVIDAILVGELCLTHDGSSVLSEDTTVTFVFEDGGTFVANINYSDSQMDIYEARFDLSEEQETAIKSALSK